MKKWLQPWGWYGLALVVIALDLWSKQVAVSHLLYDQPVRVTSFFDWRLLHNRGAAFSFLSDAGGWQRWFFTVLATAMSIAIIVWLARIARERWLESMALAFVLGGALGNLYDRITLGYVIDFISVHYKDSYFPAFNLADSAICFGAFLMIVHMLFFEKKLAENDRRADRA